MPPRPEGLMSSFYWIFWIRVRIWATSGRTFRPPGARFCPCEQSQSTQKSYIRPSGLPTGLQEGCMIWGSGYHHVKLTKSKNKTLNIVNTLPPTCPPSLSPRNEHHISPFAKHKISIPNVWATLYLASFECLLPVLSGKTLYNPFINVRWWVVYTSYKGNSNFYKLLADSKFCLLSSASSANNGVVYNFQKALFIVDFVFTVFQISLLSLYGFISDF